jgi:hypothetical protein
VFRAVFKFYFRLLTNEKEIEYHVMAGYASFTPTVFAAVKGLYSGLSGQLDSLEKGTLCMNWNAYKTAFDRGNAFTCT